jgi:hypothetical protein
MFSLRPAHLSLGPSPSNPDYGSSSSSSRRSLSSLLQVHNNLRHSKCIISQSILERIDREGSKSPSSHQSHRNQKEMSKANLHLKSPRKVLKALVFKSHSLQLDDDGTPSFVGTPEEEHEFKFELNFKEKLLNDLQHLQLDLDSRFCRLIWNDTLTSWLCSGRLKSLKLTDVG